MFQLGEKVNAEFILDYELGVSLVKQINPSALREDIKDFTLLYDEARYPFICGLNKDGILISVVKVPNTELQVEKGFDMNAFEMEYKKHVKSAKKVRAIFFVEFFILIMFMLCLGMCIFIL